MKSFRATSSVLKPLKFAPGVWRALMDDLRRRGEVRRESGACSLSKRGARVRVVRSWRAYDDLAPESLAFDYVRLESRAFPLLWDWCGRHEMNVVADVHTHPFGPHQSLSD